MVKRTLSGFWSLFSCLSSGSCAATRLHLMRSIYGNMFHCSHFGRRQISLSQSYCSLLQHEHLFPGSPAQCHPLVFTLPEQISNVLPPKESFGSPQSNTECHNIVFHTHTHKRKQSKKKTGNKINCSRSTASTFLLHNSTEFPLSISFSLVPRFSLRLAPTNF